MPLLNDVADPSAGQVPDQPLPGSLEQALGPDWLPIRAVALGGEPIDLVLLHPQHGVALLQFAPRWTVDAPERLRHRLDQARFAAIFHGHLPVVHRMIHPEEAAALPRLLAEAFAGQPGLDLPAGDAWISVVHRALLARPMALPDPPHAPPRHAGHRTMRIAGGIGLAAVLAMAAILSIPGSPPQPMAALAEAIVTATPLPVAAASPVLDAVEEPPPSEPGPLIVAAAPTEAPPATRRPIAEPSIGQAPATEPQPTEAPPIESLATPAAIEALSPPHEPPQPPAIPAPPPMLALGATPLPVVDVPPPPATPVPATPALVAPPPAPPLSRTAARPVMDAGTRGALLRRGEALLALGDVSGARRFFERVAEAGDPAGAQAMGRTHDPVVLAGLHAWGITPDPVAAAGWYRRAREMEITDMTETTR